MHTPAADLEERFGSRAQEEKPGSPRRPVVFLGVPMAINVRDVLRTDVLTTIRDAGAAVHVFTAASDVTGFRNEFEGHGVTIHPLRVPTSRWFSRVDAVVLRLQLALLSLRCETGRIKVWGALKRSVGARMFRRLLGVLGRPGQDAFLALLRRITRSAAPDLYGEAFRRHSPDLVVGTRVVTAAAQGAYTSARYLDRHLLLSAARRGIPTMVLVSSWDNLTTKGFFPLELDRITVWNDIMKVQAQVIHGIPEHRIVVTGAPQHDVYAPGRAYTARDRFLGSLGLDPERPLIAYTTGTENLIPREPEIVAVVEQRLRDAMGEGLQLLLRVHQLDSTDRYGAVEGKPGVRIEHAGNPTVGGYHDRDFDRRALERLADTLRHADVVLNVASSISIDAAAVGTPVVVLDFDARPDTPYHRSVSRFYDFTHQRPVVASGGVTRACSPAEAADAVLHYLEDPSLHSEGRARLVREQCFRLDGRAGARVGDAVVAELERRLPGWRRSPSIP